MEATQVLLTVGAIVTGLNMGAAPFSDAVFASCKLLTQWRNKEEGQEGVSTEQGILNDARTGYSYRGPGLDIFNQFPPFALLFQQARKYDLSDPIGWVGALSYAGDFACLVAHDLTEGGGRGTLVAVIGTVGGGIMVGVAPWFNDSTIGPGASDTFVVGIWTPITVTWSGAFFSPILTSWQQLLIEERRTPTIHASGHTSQQVYTTT